VNHRQSWMNRKAFTLIEVVLVLAIVAVVAAMAWPAVQRLYAGRRVNSAADRVRSAWCQARVEAMRSGRTYAFRYEPGGDRFRTELQPDADPSASSAVTAGRSAGGTASAAPTGGQSQPVEDQSLPEGVKFSADAACNRAASTSHTAPRSASGSTDGWSDPILFYPDGTTSDVQLVLTSPRSLAIRMILRGMTGTVTIADLEAVVE
jgi:prepilin-type N-terminal cleavage/methylation domain-containing protein